MRSYYYVFFICIILTIFLFTLYICIYPQSYRLGDMIRRKDNVISKLAWYMHFSPSTIGGQYIRRTSKPVDLDILNSIVPVFQAEETIVHLRLGDVLENHPRSVTSFWEGNYIMCNKQDEIGVTGSHHGHTSEGYVKSREFYESIIPILKIHNVIDIHLIGGIHNSSKSTKSMEYVNCVKDLFQLHGFRVHIHICKQPTIKNVDNDFTRMCNSKIFIPSGGGYSYLIKCIVKKRKHIVSE